MPPSFTYIINPEGNLDIENQPERPIQYIDESGDTVTSSFPTDVGFRDLQIKYTRSVLSVLNADGDFDALAKNVGILFTVYPVTQESIEQLELGILHMIRFCPVLNIHIFLSIYSRIRVMRNTMTRESITTSTHPSNLSADDYRLLNNYNSLKSDFSRGYDLAKTALKVQS